MNKNFIPRGKGDLPREFSTFAAYPIIEGVSSNQLEEWIEAVRIQPISAIEWQWQEKWTVGPRSINDSMWFWFEKGFGWAWIGNEENKIRLSPGSIMLIPPGVEHKIMQDEGERMYLIAIHFQAQVFGGINILDLLGFPAHIADSSNLFFEGASKRIAREFAVKSAGWTKAFNTEVFNVLIYILRQHGNKFHTPVRGKSLAELPRLLPALKVIDKNLSNPELTITDIAGCLFLSEVQFRKIFKRVTNLSPTRFIQRRRIERACVLLRTTKMSVEQIAEACGFNDPPFFYRVFKTWTKTSPDKYRKIEKFR